MRFILGPALADPKAYNRPLNERIINGRLVTIELISVGGAQFVTKALESAVRQFRTYLAGTLRVIEPVEMECSLGADQSISRDVLDDLLASRKHQLPSDIALVVVPSISGQERRGDAAGQTNGSSVVVIQADTIDRSRPRICSRQWWWRIIILHELCHCFGLPAQRSHVWKGRHCTHPGCVLYPRVDARSMLSAILRLGPPRKLCSACRSEIQRAREKMAGELLDPALPHKCEALDFYNQLVDLNPGEARAFVQRARHHIDCEDYKDAIDDFNKALSLTPNNVDYIVCRASIYHLNGDIRTAITEYERCLELQPESVFAMAGLSQILSTCSDDTFRDGRRALDLASQACNLLAESKDWALASLAAAHAELGDFSKAVEIQSKALSLTESESLYAKPEDLENYRNGKPRRDPVSLP